MGKCGEKMDGNGYEMLDNVGYDVRKWWILDDIGIKCWILGGEMLDIG